MNEAEDVRAACERVRWSLTVPALVRDRQLTVVASNRLAQALSPAFQEGVNLARFTFLDSVEYEDDVEWAEQAAEVAAMLRVAVDTEKQDPQFRRLVGELSARSAKFARTWATSRLPRTEGLQSYPTAVGSITVRYREDWVDSSRDHATLTFSPVDAAAAQQLRALSAFLLTDPFRRER